ncbi:AAA family ATPase [Proteiniborus sp. MB09-C3]|uniref:ATP-binding protein n=1 Tax=Proteiniborus sp. MB09-C3 TaxID=3050072 RepID=UPI002552D8E2|nr:AAA family ATPase [Proteiniborus sp. MB09-C3]WIV11493.1 AAA family ATPase [Proteiniborus sp. MB09-C3]
MIVRELLLTSFGKFKGKSITLEDGFNIVYGDNEAGKTTIHKFIEGMFFGFFKPYIKRKIYSDDYDRFLPWDHTDYSGVLKYIAGNDVYRIERNFLKGSDEVKIIDDKTGEDISHFFEYDNVTRLHQPMSIHMGLNSIVFNNTISISQLKSKAEDALSKEVKDSLINLGGSLDEDISIKKVLEKFDEKINDIGTEKRTKTSPYGKIVEEIEQLQNERKKAQAISLEVKEYQEASNSLSDKIRELNEKKAEIQGKINLLEVFQAREKYNECLRLSEEINALKKQVEELKEFSVLSNDDYTESIKYQQEIRTLNENKGELKEKQSKFQTRHKKIKAIIDQCSYFEGIESEEIEQLIAYFNIMDQKKQDLEVIYDKIAGKSAGNADINNKNVNEKLYRYEELEEQKNSLSYSNEHNNIMFLNTRLDEKSKSLKKIELIKILSTLGALLSVALGFIISKALYFVSAIPLILLIYTFFSSKELNIYIDSLKAQIIDIEEKERQRKSKVEELEKDMLDILFSCGCKSKAELRKLANDIAQKNFAANEVLELKNKKNSLIEEIQMLEDKIKRYLNLIKEDVVSMDNIRKLKSRYYGYLEQKRHEMEIFNEINDLLKDVKDIDCKQKNLGNNLIMLYKKNNVNSIDSFKEGLEKKRSYERSIQLLESQKSLLNNILGDNNIEFLKKKSEDFTETIEEDIKELDKEKLLVKLKEINDKILETKNELTRFEEKIRILSSTTAELVQIEEEIIRKNNIKDEFERTLSSLELARATIDKISRNIQRDFAPGLNSRIEKIIKKVTVGKYTDIKITENLDIKVVDPSNNRIVDVEKLSGGTIDQLYFAMRFGIIDIIKEENNLPLILDDCFVQYDFDRLENILEFLSNESLKRQIILFTCHTREKEVLKNKGVKFNLVNLQ